MTALPVTIGMPLYNSAATLQASIESLCGITASGIEKIIVSDDGSTDATPQILARWAASDPRVEIVRQPKNIGTVHNFDYLARRAKTPLFMYAAHDDAWSPNYIGELRSALAAKPSAGLAFARNVLMDAELKSELKVIPAFEIEGKTRLDRARFALKRARSGWIYGLYRTPALHQSLAAVDTYGHPWGHDFVMLLPFALSGELASSDAAIFYQRITTVSESSWRSKDAAGQFARNTALRRAARTVLAQSGFTRAQQISLAPALNTYIGRHTFKLRDIAARRAAELIGLAK